MIWLILAVLLTGEANAYILPYRTRTRDFSSWIPATQGDTKTIGMAGATVALPTSVTSAESNAAGFAMTTESVSAQISNTTYNDQRLQRSDESITTSQAGFGISPERWGFALALYSPQGESGTYVSPNTGDTVKARADLRELRLIIARRLLNDDLALGFALGLAKSTLALNNESADAYALSYQLSALYRLPGHVLIGASYSPELKVGPSGGTHFESIMPGFNRAMVRPGLLTVGAGWLPNRYFRLGLSLTLVGGTTNTALLYDEEVRVGNGASWVPRLGASYVIALYANFKAEVAVGSYYESSRLSNMPDRIHATAGLEINPSFINLGVGLDIASGFQNFIVGAGIDLIRVARFFAIIPQEDPPSYTGLFPRITTHAPDGLPEGLTSDDPKPHGGQASAGGVTQVTQVVADVPSNVVKKAIGEKTSVEIQEAKAKKKKEPKQSKEKSIQKAIKANANPQ
jgi:hypothetical protein